MSGWTYVAYGCAAMIGTLAFLRITANEIKLAGELIRRQADEIQRELERRQQQNAEAASHAPEKGNEASSPIHAAGPLEPAGDLNKHPSS